MTSACPRCSSVCDRRDGPYFVCTECRWCWTVSVTGKVYVQSPWPRRGSSADDRSARERSRRLLGSVEGLADKLAATEWPSPPGVEPASQARLEQARAAVEADFYNEGLPHAQLRAEGVWLPAGEDQSPRGEPL